MSDFFQELIAGFELEAAELVDAAAGAILEMEAGQEDATKAQSMDRLGRSLHTIKGSSATCGLVDVSELAHRLEDKVAPFRKEGQTLPPEQADLLLKGLDIILSRVKAHAKGQGKFLPNIQAAFPAAFLSESTPIQESFPQNSFPAGALPQQEEPIEFDANSWRVDNRQVLNLMREVESLRELRLNLADREKEMGRAIDALGQASLDGVSQGAKAPLQRLKLELSYDFETTTALVERMEEHLKGIYSVSLAKALEPLQRLVRDTCRATGKRAHLALSGGELNLDRRLIEGLYGPLVHLIRNSIDHGIEAPELRDSLGKHAEGALTLRMEQQGNWLQLEVSDDGKGLSMAALKGSAQKKGLLSAAEAEGLSDSDALNLIFLPGFSTKTEVSRISGRGIGLDVVKNAVKQLHGSIEVHSVEGKGTRFLMAFPLTLGASPMLLLRAGQGVFGIPTQAVETVFKAEADMLDKVGELWRLRAGDQWVEIADLGVVLGLGGARQVEAGSRVVLLQSQGKKIALVVEALEGDSEFVILPLPEGLTREAAFQGAALHSGGELMLVLRPDWLIQHAGQRGGAQAGLKVLVIDDSLTARAMHRGILESGGYLVHVASSAEQGLTMLSHARYDLIICDVSMEGMSGLEFAQRVKKGPSPLDTPLVLVSAHDAEREREAALQCGAEAFISKRDCAAGRLLKEVGSLRTTGAAR